MPALCLGCLWSTEAQAASVVEVQGTQNETVDSETPRCFAMVLLRDATTKGPSSKQAELFVPWLFGSALCSTFNSGLLVTQQVVIVLDMQQDENTNMLASKLSTDVGWVLLNFSWCSCCGGAVIFGHIDVQFLFCASPGVPKGLRSI